MDKQTYTEDNAPYPQDSHGQFVEWLETEPAADEILAALRHGAGRLKLIIARCAPAACLRAEAVSEILFDDDAAIALANNPHLSSDHVRRVADWAYDRMIQNPRSIGPAALNSLLATGYALPRVTISALLDILVTRERAARSEHLTASDVATDLVLRSRENVETDDLSRVYEIHKQNITQLVEIIRHPAAGPPLWLRIIESKPHESIYGAIAKLARARHDPETRAAIVRSRVPTALRELLRDTDEEEYRSLLRVMVTQDAGAVVRFLEEGTLPHAERLGVNDLVPLLQASDRKARLGAILILKRLRADAAATPINDRGREGPADGGSRTR